MRSCHFEWLEERRLLSVDWGDAPDTGAGTGPGNYQTLSTDNGPSHDISGVYLGGVPDDEQEAWQSSDALGDDNNGTAPDDEDGIVFLDQSGVPLPGVPTLMPGGQFSVQYTIAGGPGGYVRGWIDFNGDGDFADTGELFLDPGGKPAGTHYSSLVTVPANATIGTTFARFRIAGTNPSPFEPTGHLTSGEVEDYQVLIQEEPDELDFGDAPDTGAGTGPGNYQTLSADNGASHIIVTGAPYFGISGDQPDAETDGQPDSAALGDDNDGNDDENGVWFPDPLLPDTDASVSFVVGVGGNVRGWIDFNRNGVWGDDPGELIVDGSFAPGTYSNLPFHVPDVQPGTTFARFRITSTNPTSFDPTGPLDDGEVEDHEAVIEEPQLLDWGDAPQGIPGYPDYPTTGTDGASHVIVPDGPFLGNPSDPADPGNPDAEEDGQPDVDALGDDNDGNDDENGVEFLTPLVAGQDFTIRYEVDGAGTSQNVTLYGWIDYTGDGTWSDDPDELFLEVIGLTDGVYEETYTVPSWVTLEGDTYARFRICDTISTLSPYGPLENGEVEDYKVTITVVEEDLDWGDANQDDVTYFYPTLESLNGARHLIVPGGPYFGDSDPLVTGEPDAEPDGQPDFFAEGDDFNGFPDDENGVQFLDQNGDPFPGTPTLTPGQPFMITVIVEGTGTPGVRGWIDFNGDQQWDNADDLFLDWGFGVAPGTYTETFTVPSNAVLGDTYARFRITSTTNQFDATGRLEDGEVEDYHLEIVAPQEDFGDAPQGIQDYPDYPTLLPDGARHLIVPGGPYLGLDGDQPDAEPDGQPDAEALGDDQFVNEDNYDDENGVQFDTPLRIDEDFEITYWVGGSGGALHGWIDFNADGDWDDPGEHFLNRDEHVAAGMYTETFHVPADATLGETFARFRIATYEEGMTFEPTGPKDDGEVEDYRVEILGPAEDFGDAPQGIQGFPDYPTLLPDGARHVIVPNGPFLGQAGDEPDAELDGQPDDQAEGDDYNDFNDDEDGVIFNTTPLIVGEPFEITYWVGGSGGALHGWIDFNADGDWDDPGEHFLNNAFHMPPGEYPQQFDATVWPEDVAIGTTFARFRISTESMSFGPTGPLSDGEVEDYSVTIEEPPPVTDFGDAPDTGAGTGPGNYQTLAADNGASHVVGGPFLGPDGDEPDTEPDGIPHAEALGDDNTGFPDDEDGVTFTTDLVPGRDATVRYEVNGGGGALRGWVDFNGNGVWGDDPNELIVDHTSIGDGIYDETFPVPADAVPGDSFARFRITSTAPASFDPTGPLDDGEVEDHRVVIETPPAEVVGRHVFYNESAFDGNNQFPTADDDNAIAPDKSALLPGQTATFANYTSYTKGINGIMVDIAGLGGTPTRSDFAFRMGNDSEPDLWPAAPDPRYVVVRAGAGVGGSDRVTLIWDNYPNPASLYEAVGKQWLQVTVLATPNTGLVEPDVFYFGNALGDSGLGNFGGKALVTAVDSGAVRDNPHNPFVVPAPIDDFVDFNRDEWVNAVDFGFVRDNATNFLTALVLITAPAAGSSPGPQEAPAEPDGFTPLGTTELLAGQDAKAERSALPAALASRRLGTNLAAVDTFFGEGGLPSSGEETEPPSEGGVGILGGDNVLAAAVRALGGENAKEEETGGDTLAEPLDDGLLDLIALDRAGR